MPPPKTMMLFVMLGVAVVMALRKKNNSRAAALFSQFQGSQKLFAAIAVLAAIVILLNPEFLALGLLGDTAFYDVLVLLLGLQLRTVGAQAWDCIRTVGAQVCYR